jgi:hypothetical protein
MDTILLRRASLLACGLSLIMLSVLAAAAQPLSPADEAHRVLLPLVLKSELPVGITNGDFEDGHTAWDEYSQRGYPLIYHRSASDFPPLDPHSGDWLAWLGGGHNEVSRLSQTFTIPASATRLSYYLWIASEDFCSPDYDIWRLIVDADNHVTPDDILDGYPLCEDSSTPGWIRREVDITRYAGQHVILTFVVSTDASLYSSLFVDDVSLDTAPLQPLVELPQQPLLAVPSRAAAP